MSMITLEQFKEIFDLMPGEPEFEIFFYDNPTSYTIIKIGEGATFQRVGDEVFYPSFDVLFESELIDGIVLSRDWDKIELVEVDSTWILSHPLDVEDLLSKYRKG